MSIEVIEFKDQIYPKFQSTGFASKFAFPFAKEVCKGKGLDIGCMKTEWAFPGAIPIDIGFNDGYHALNLPEGEFGYLFSSHCIEHVDNWVTVLDYWYTKLKEGGTLFLYLPDYSQEYWKPWNNKKHVHILSPTIIRDYLEDKGYRKVFVSGVDLNNSFTAIAEK